MRKLILGLICIFFLTGCESSNRQVPIVEAWQQQPPSVPRGFENARPHTTRYIIPNQQAPRQPIVLKKVAPIKPIKQSSTNVTLVKKPPIPTKQPKIERAKIQTPPPVTSKTTLPPPTPTISSNQNNGTWIWPIRGKVINSFNTGGKGINIAAPLGTKVLASGDGRVAYSGNGLRGYGSLIIIKHNEVFFSAYAHNSKILVQEGDRVKKGQVIAEVGDTEANRAMLHFEIRRAGKPVDPLLYLPKA